MKLILILNIIIYVQISLFAQSENCEGKDYSNYEWFESDSISSIIMKNEMKEIKTIIFENNNIILDNIENIKFQKSIIFNINAEIVYKDLKFDLLPSNKIEIDKSYFIDLSIGTYFLVLKNNSLVQTYKILKIK